MSPAPELSIVMPLFNVAPFIEETLHSILALEEEVPCEVIIQNARSTDGTSEIVERYCRNRPHWHHINEADRGQSDAINRGTHKATGRWVTWLCGDDLMLPGAAAMIREAEQTSAGVCYGDVLFRENGIMAPAFHVEEYRLGDMARRRMMFEQRGTFVKKEVWDTAGGVQESLHWTMDYDLFLRIESAGIGCHRSRHFVALANIHPEAKTSSGSFKRLLEMWGILWASHRRCPRYFRIRPYLCYGIEYVIKRWESSPNPSAFVRRVLPRLHQLFWRLANPKEKAEVEKRMTDEMMNIQAFLKTLPRYRGTAS